nr:hypothetical protein [Streptomyces swartbergensis]
MTDAEAEAEAEADVEAEAEADVDVDVDAGGVSPSGRQKATLPVRAGSPGRNTAQQWASSEKSEEGAGGVGCSAMTDSSNLTSGSESPRVQHFPQPLGMTWL